MDRRKSRQTNDDRLGFGPISLVLLSFGSIFAFILYLNFNRPPELDSYNCPIDDTLISENVILLFDTTEAYIASQKAEITNRVSSIVNSVEPLGKITAFEISSSEDSAINSVPLTDEEYPYLCPVEGGLNTPSIVEKFNASLLSSVGSQILDNVQENDQSSSRILDGLRFVAANTIDKPYKSLIYVFSDMLEYSDVISMYNTAWFDQYQSNRSQILSQRPIFPNNTEIEIFVISRPQVNVNEGELLRFWTETLSGDGFNSNVLPSFTRISGGL